VSDYTVVTHEQRPDLDHDDWPWFLSAWHEFMFHDPVCGTLWHHLTEDHPRHQVYLLDAQGNGIGVGNAIPFAWDGRAESLPEGIDGVFPQAVADREEGRAPTALSAIQAVVHPDLQGQGLSRVLISAMADTARAVGLTALVAPVRPTMKPLYPLVPMERYVRWTRDDGLPFDPWMRVHARLGAEVVKVCHLSMTIAGTVADWEKWTGMAFPDSGDYVVPGALVTVAIDRDRDEGVYVEPNVWMRHPL
jgi:GNAT superfamily N-acetyltransferase